MPLDYERLITTVTKEHAPDALQVTVKVGSMFFTKNKVDMQLIVGEDCIGKMHYEVHSGYLLIKKVSSKPEYKNVYAALFEYAFKQSDLLHKNGQIRFEVLEANDEEWKKYGFEFLKKNDSKLHVLHFSYQTIEQKLKEFSSELAVNPAVPSPVKSPSNAVLESKSGHEDKDKKEKSVAVKGQPKISNLDSKQLLKEIEAVRQEHTKILSQLGVIQEQLNSANQTIQAMSTIPLDNLILCLGRMKDYIQTYIDSTHTFSSMNLFQFHGAEGRKRAIEYLKNWSENIEHPILANYRLLYNALSARGILLKEDRLHAIFTEALGEMQRAAQQSVMTVGGNKHPQSLRMYLLAYANELESILTSTSSSKDAYKHAIQFPLNMGPASIDAFLELERLQRVPASSETHALDYSR